MLGGGNRKLFISGKGCIGPKLRARLELVSRGSTRRHSSHAGTSGEACSHPDRQNDLGGIARCSIVRYAAAPAWGVWSWGRNFLFAYCVESLPSSTNGIEDREGGVACHVQVRKQNVRGSVKGGLCMVCRVFGQSEVASNQSIGRHWFLLRRGHWANSSIERG